MANGETPVPNADALRQQADALVQAILDRAAVVTEVGENSARMVRQAIENYARHTEAFVHFCRQTTEQAVAATSQLEPLTGRPTTPIDTDKMEREIREAPPQSAAQMPRMPRMPGAPQR